MNVKCKVCGTRYDDADRSTLCPHVFFLSAEDLEQKKVALSLLGKDVYFAHRPEEFYRVQAVSRQGMVSISGMVGEFAPHLFKVKE